MFNMTLKQQSLIIFCVLCVGFLNHLLGVSKGIFIATLHKKELNTFMKLLDEHEQSGEPIDLHEIDKIIEDEEK